jgi:hypothetical protein
VDSGEVDGQPLSRRSQPSFNGVTLLGGGVAQQRHTSLMLLRSGAGGSYSSMVLDHSRSAAVEFEQCGSTRLVASPSTPLTHLWNTTGSDGHAGGDPADEVCWAPSNIVGGDVGRLLLADATCDMGMLQAQRAPLSYLADVRGMLASNSHAPALISSTASSWASVIGDPQ